MTAFLKCALTMIYFLAEMSLRDVYEGLWGVTSNIVVLSIPGAIKQLSPSQKHFPTSDFKLLHNIKKVYHQTWQIGASMRECFGNVATEPYLRENLRDACQDLDDFYKVEEIQMELNVSKVRN